MQLFYIPDSKYPILDGEEYFHCIKVLRKKVKNKIFFTDGNGNLFSSIIKEIQRNTCHLENVKKIKSIKKRQELEVAISIIKSQNRLEWLVEKLSEIGISKISFIISENSEKKKLKYDRLIKKSISALKQCNSLFLTEINNLISLEDYIIKNKSHDNKYYAEIGSKKKFIKPIKNTKLILLIGPEGDFSQIEKDKIVSNGFQDISLGENILRTETAAVVGGYMLKNL